MSKTRKFIVPHEVFSNSIANDNAVIEEVVSALIEEAVKHFSTSRIREYADDARYFYSKREVTTFFSLFTGDPSKLVCKVIPDDNGGVLCYEICRISLKSRH